MTELASVLLETETALPMELTSWVVLLVSLAITVAWLVYLYR